MHRVYNFSAGPAILPEAVLKKAQQELLDWNGSGMSVTEVSHRSEAFVELTKKAEKDLREILNIPNNYKVLFMHGGGRGQFAMVPMNLLGSYKKASYVITGVWSEIAAKEASQYGSVEIVANSTENGFTAIPPQEQWKSFKDAAYLHFVDNETMNGVEFPYVPNVSNVADAQNTPLACDMSSNILSRPIEIEKFGVIYACAQKNLAPAGITLVIIREDLLERQPIATTPSIFRYKVQSEQDSMLNTPTTFSWYIAGLVFEWIKEQGGIHKLAEINLRKSKKLYDYIDQSGFYKNPVDPKYRSRMNVVFRLPNEKLDSQFVKEAEQRGLTNLKGHRVVGGIRASIYNAMPETGVDALIDFMQEFLKKNG